jgi:catechol 2,3-dioxygenase-like lactoylglutathione lyase family enzyme
MHGALIIDDIHAALAALSAAGYTPVGTPLAIPGGARHGSLFAYVHDPGGVTVELIQLAVPEPG